MTAADAPPIVFVHGTRFSAGQWSSQLATAFADAVRRFARQLPVRS
ncbi:hypothetical protein AB0D54_15050 [Streptomyces xanthophaeus]